MAWIILLASRFTWQSIKVSSLPHLRRESIEPVCRVRPCSTTTAEECCCSSLAPVWPASLPSWTTCSCDHLMTSRLTHRRQRQHQWRHSASLCQIATHVRRQQRLSEANGSTTKLLISLTNRLLLCIPHVRTATIRSFGHSPTPAGARDTCHGCIWPDMLVSVASKPNIKFWNLKVPIHNTYSTYLDRMINNEIVIITLYASYSSHCLLFVEIELFLQTL